MALSVVRVSDDVIELSDGRLAERVLKETLELVESDQQKQLEMYRAGILKSGDTLTFSDPEDDSEDDLKWVWFETPDPKYRGGWFLLPGYMCLVTCRHIDTAVDYLHMFKNSSLTANGKEFPIEIP